MFWMILLPLEGITTNVQQRFLYSRNFSRNNGEHDEEHLNTTNESNEFTSPTSLFIQSFENFIITISHSSLGMLSESYLKFFCKVEKLKIIGVILQVKLRLLTSPRRNIRRNIYRSTLRTMKKCPSFTTCYVLKLDRHPTCRIFVLWAIKQAR